MQLIQFVRGTILDLEWRYTRASKLNGEEIPLAECMWKDLIMWNARCGWFTTTIRDNILSLGIALSDPDFTNTLDWMSSDKDYQLIYHQLLELQQKMTFLVSLNTGLAGLSDSKQSVLEAKRSVREANGMKTLTLLGLIFIPLEFTCELLSMNEQYLPGGSKFWLYFAISLPLIFVVFFVVWLLQLGYDSDGRWSFMQLGSSLKAWEWSNL